MNMIRKAVSPLGGIFLATLLIAALAPKAVRSAVAAALVQVTNTSANPVPAVISGTPFEAFLCEALGPTFGCEDAGNNFVVPSTTVAGAPVKRLIVEYVSGTCEAASNAPVSNVFLTGPFVADAVANIVTLDHAFPLALNNGTISTFPFGQPSLYEYTFATTTRIYFNPGDQVSVGAGSLDCLCQVELDGTLVTQ